MTGKSEFRSKRKVNISLPNFQNSDHQARNGTINIMKDSGEFQHINLPLDLDFNNDENSKQVSHGKFTRKSGPKNSSTDANPLLNFSGKEGRSDGHNYTVSINFNRPQQSKGKRIKISKD